MSPCNKHNTLNKRDEILRLHLAAPYGNCFHAVSSKRKDARLHSVTNEANCTTNQCWRPFVGKIIKFSKKIALFSKLFNLNLQSYLLFVSSYFSDLQICKVAPTTKIRDPWTSQTFLEFLQVLCKSLAEEKRNSNADSQCFCMVQELRSAQREPVVK